MTPLHDTEALVGLAESGPPEVRGWANLRLAVHAPDALRGLPPGGWDRALAIAVGAPRTAALVLEDIASGVEGAALSAENLSSFGLLPEGDEGAVEVLRAAIGGEGAPDDLYLAQALGDLGALDGRALGAAARAEAVEQSVALPALVLRLADAQGALGEAVPEVADALVARGRPDETVPAVLSLLGVAFVHLGAARELDEVARLGAGVAGGEVRKRLEARGGQRRRIQRAVRTLLDGVEGPAAALVRALAERDAFGGLDLVAAAGWLQVPPDDDPVQAVLRQASQDRPALTRARRALGAEHAVDVLAQVEDVAVAVAPAAVLCPDLATGPSGGDLLEALAVRAAEGPVDDQRLLMALTLVGARRPDDLLPLLELRGMRTAALEMARLAPFEEVLEAVLRMPAPGELEARRSWADALGEMGHPATLPTLRALAEHDDDAQITAALRRAEGLLGTSGGAG